MLRTKLQPFFCVEPGGEPSYCIGPGKTHTHTRLLTEGPLRPSALALLGGLELSHTCPNASAYTDAPLQGTAPQLTGWAVLGSVPSHTVPTRPGAPGSLERGDFTNLSKSLWKASKMPL